MPRTLLLATALLGLASLAQAAPVATVSVAEGKPALEHAGGRQPLAARADIAEGDIVDTGAGGHVELEFRDGSRVALAADTRFRVRTYDFDAGKQRPGTGLFDLLAGAMRGLTGALTAVPGHRVEIATAVATIGIRGTEFTAEIGDNDLSVAMVEGTGVYVRTQDGAQTELDQPLTGTRVPFRRDANGQLLAGQVEPARALDKAEVARLVKRIEWRQAHRRDGKRPRIRRHRHD